MKLVFCSDPLKPRSVDEAYAAEAAAATDVGLEYVLIDYEALASGGDPEQAVRRVPEQPELVTGIYRGWMLRPAQYEALYQGLAAKNIRLINDPVAYLHCHYLPESYSVIEDSTPRSAWLKMEGDLDMDRVMDLLRPFGARPVIVKDFVKSRKHEWEEACFIPSAADRSAVERVVRRFLELQDEDLNEGLVFREYIDFEPLGRHSKSGMPLTLEFRIFWLDARAIYWSGYWEEGDYGDLRPPVEQFQAQAQRVQSRFFTMDMAKTKDGEWMIVELGDGQVAGLPEHADVRSFYLRVRDGLR